MRSKLALNVSYLVTGLLVLSVFALLVVEKSRHPLIVTGNDAVQAAIAYLAKEEITINPATVEVTFVRGKWHVYFFVTPDRRPAGILVKVNPINGNAELIPLR